MRLAACLAAFLVFAQDAAALSCLRPDVARSFNEAETSEDVYSIVRGRFGFGPATPPREGRAGSVPARFEGWVLTPDGFVPADPQRVAVQIGCDDSTGMACGAIPPDREVVAFLRHGDDGLVLELGPCPRWLFPDPTRDLSARLTECMTGGICEPGG